MESFYRSLRRIAALLCLASMGCTQDFEAPDLDSGWDREPLAVAFSGNVNGVFRPGETRTLALEVSGAATLTAEAPKGWSALCDGSSVTLAAPAANATGYEVRGTLRVTAADEAGESREATLRVYYSEALTVEFVSHAKLELIQGGALSVPFVATGVERFEVVAPRGWTAAVGEDELLLAAPALTALEYEKSGKVTLKAYGNGAVAEDSVEVEMAQSTDLNADGATANCYIVAAGGRYTFDATVMGNGERGLNDGLKAVLAQQGDAVVSASLPQAARAFLLWESSQGSITDVALTPDRRRVGFVAALSSDVRKGNAVIAVADDADKILWSWHVWMTDRPAEQTYKNGFVMMDRNLGACSAEPATLESHGLQYQWGRKDPFPGGCAVNAGNGQGFEPLIMDNTLPTFNAAGHDFMAVPVSAETGTIDFVTSNPHVFVYTIVFGGNGDWHWNGRNTHLWGNPEGYLLENGARRKGAKSIYDPCPPGYRVPDADVYAIFSSNGSLGGIDTHVIHGTVNDYRVPTDYKGNAGGSWIVGLNFLYDDAGNYSWYPAAGCRISETGCMQAVGMNIYAWTNAPYSASKPKESFYLWASKEYMYPMRDGGDHAYSRTVRCCKE